MKSQMRTVVAVLVMVMGGATWGQAQPATKPQRFIKEIEAFEAKDKQSMPAPGGIVFVGSSSIRIWKVDEAFPGLPVLNRGFGGSHISDSIDYFDRIVLPYKPKLIVFYAGDNDIAAGKTPERVANDFATLVGMVHKSLPGTKMVVIGIKPSISRWKLIEPMRDANRRIAAVADKDPLVTYVSVEEAMLGADGKPRPELFRKDGLHMEAAGYDIWNKMLKPYVEAAAGER